MKKLTRFLALSLILFGCQKEATETVSKGEFNVEFLFEHDGCRMYRFKDSRYIYWSDCRGQIDNRYQVKTGKHSSRQVDGGSITTE